MSASTQLLDEWLNPGSDAEASAKSSRSVTPQRVADLTRALARALAESREGVDTALACATCEILDRFRHPSVRPALQQQDLDIDAFLSLAEALHRHLAVASRPDSDPLKQAAWSWLDLLRRPPLTPAVAACERVEQFADVAVRLIDAADFTFGRLFAQRAATYGPRTLFRVVTRGREGRRTWVEVGLSVDQVACGLCTLVDRTGGKPVAMLSENRYESAIVDLACLTSGIVNVMIPASLTAPDVEYILAESQCGTIVVSNRRQLAKIPHDPTRFPALEHVVLLDEAEATGSDTLSYSQLLALGRNTSLGELRRRREAVVTTDLATVMYTSGTTGAPKGIRFNQRNVVSKRFCRGLALPEIGDTDVFVCYLPLFHTFGRFLEMCGCIHWGATYVFQENPAVDLLRKSLRDWEASVLISIPKKWMELYEEITRRVDIDRASPEQVQAATRAVVGPRLRYGLSAAGYLPPEIFRFFQSQGVELMSGFGMTEATGGILMTPPGQYRDGSLGLPLPGIECKLIEDGELVLRGPYVMIGYAGDAPSGVDDAGWVKSGDLMWQDETGHYFFLDRKKEIYKNIKGQTIAPQRIENYFREFDSVKNVFLVGDRRDYNTALIVPNIPNCGTVGATSSTDRSDDVSSIDLSRCSAAQLRDHFRGLVFSVNRFLAPFERVLDFAVLDRDFDAEKGELTPKATFRRSKVVENFDGTIEGLYRKGKMRFPGVEIALRVPYWLYQAASLTTEDLQVHGNSLRIGSRGTELVIEGTSAEGETDEGEYKRVRIGSCLYRVRGFTVDIGIMLRTPALWLGNEELLRLLDLAPSDRVRGRRPPSDLLKLSRSAPPRPFQEVRAGLEAATRAEEVSLEQLSLAAGAVLGDHEEIGRAAVHVLGRTLDGHDRLYAEAALQALRSAYRSPFATVRRLAFQQLLPAEHDNEVERTLRIFLLTTEDLIDQETAEALSGQVLSDAKIAAFFQRLKPACAMPERRAPSLAPWIHFAQSYGAAHPARYRALRWVLTFMRLLAPRHKDRLAARTALRQLTDKFRQWIRPPVELAIDPVTQTEYQWPDVVVWGDDVAAEDRDKLLAALSQTSMLREALFLLGRGTIIGLANIRPGGLAVSFLGERHGKRVYRLSVQTRTQGLLDVVVNLATGISELEAEDEVDWLTVAAEPRGGEPLVERVGGYWSEQRLWTEEFIPGETVEQIVARLAATDDEASRLRLRTLWPFLVWSAAWAYLEFWERSGRRLVLGSPHPSSVIVPSHDYLVDPRVVSLSNRRGFVGLGALLSDLYQGLVVGVEQAYPVLRGVSGLEPLFSALLEVTGTAAGVELLRAAEHEREDLVEAATAFIERVTEHGFIPRRLHFAIDRFHRWGGINPDASASAVARNLRQIYEIYHLSALRHHYPETRVRFFRATVFSKATGTLTEGLDEIIDLLLARPLDPEELVDRVAALRVGLEAGSDEEYFLTRMLYPHLRPEDAAVFGYTSLGGTRQTDLVASLMDRSGRSYMVRHPVSPREIGRVQRLFEEARLPITFRSEQSFLLAVPDRGEPIGALVYDLDLPAGEAHFDKIAVSAPFRRTGVGEGLMREFISRMGDLGIRLVTAGYFRSEFISRFGFKLDHRHSGQTLRLQESE